jgi:uncharacterized membrane protein YhaH (DUF805 family)
MNLKYLFTNFEGRIGRGDWWKGVLVLFLISIVASVLFGSDGLVPFIINVLVLLAGLALHLKRLHDRGKSWPWLLILLIPVVNLIWAVIDLGILEGEPSANRYGPPPLAGGTHTRLT